MRSPHFTNAVFFYNARLITEKRIISNSWLLVEQGRISRFGSGLKPRCKAANHINVQGNYIAPGFIDLHIHGQVKKISEYQAKHGTTSFLLSLHAQSFHQLYKNISVLKSPLLNGAQCLGVHLEGPFINQDMAGAQPRGFIKDPDLPEIKSFIKKTGRQIKIITLAPELKNASALLNILKKNKIVAALGHTNATIEQAKEAAEEGARYTTHIFNRMSGITSRNPGVITKVLIDDRITAEVIADGHHVHPDNLKLLVKNKPVDKIVLVTDSVQAMDDESLKMIAGVYRQEDYTIAGSRLTMLQAVKNMIHLCAVSLQNAIKMATINPAKVIGIDKKKGRIAKGFDADLVIFDKKFSCQATIVAGKIVYNRLS